MRVGSGVAAVERFDARSIMQCVETATAGNARFRARRDEPREIPDLAIRTFREKDRINYSE